MTPPGALDDTLVKSYRYLRAAMVGVLLCLGAAVAYQSIRQSSTLSSISAYYYTPAQAIFVGALVALGVCMIALEGTTRAEDVLLTIGGMLAPVVAIVPTSRGADFRAAVQACRESGGVAFPDQPLTAVDCPGVRALVEAAEANIDNNMVAVLVAGAAGLLVTLLFAKKDRKPFPTFRRSFTAAALLYAVVLVAFVVARQAFIDSAHWVAAIGLFACIVAVAIVNALRHQNRPVPAGAGLRETGRTVVRALAFRDVYATVAVAMVVVAAIGTPLVVFQVYATALFWLEAALIVLFALFWIVQTRERWDDDRPPEQPPADAVTAVRAR